MSHDPDAVPIHDASTVMLVRPSTGGRGFEVYLTRRRPELVFVGGAYVFPGGRVDKGDAAPEVIARCAGLTRESAALLMGEPEREGVRAAAYWVAAVRELFEEAGVLLAYSSGRLLEGEIGRPEGALGEWRRRLNAGEADIGAMVDAEGLRLATDRLRYVSHWITPVGPPRRFSTRFFLALHPPGQEADHHDLEISESIWIPPAEALEAWAESRLTMIPPTVMSLQRLAEYDRLEDLLAAFPGP
jgi:8-oxo-dGTP pyrophosphatase MutT (NUDIX family)